MNEVFAGNKQYGKTLVSIEPFDLFSNYLVNPIYFVVSSYVLQDLSGNV